MTVENTARGDFVPEAYRRRLWDDACVYGVRLKAWEYRALRDRIDQETGADEEPMLSRVMDSFSRDMAVERRVRRIHGKCGHADVTIQTCEDLGINWREFPHNTPTRPLATFVEHAKQRLDEFKLAKNETQWDVQSKRIQKLFDAWAQSNCCETACEDRGHRDCADGYDELICWEIAKQIAIAEDDKRRLLAAMDSTPRGKAVRVANDALVRISIRDPKRLGIVGTSP